MEGTSSRCAIILTWDSLWDLDVVLLADADLSVGSGGSQKIYA